MGMGARAMWPFVLAGAAVARPLATPQGPATTFKSSVEYVAVDARVLDASNTPIPGLTRQEFQIFEDGVAQELATFSAVDIPLPEPASPEPLAKGVPASPKLLAEAGQTPAARVRPDTSTNSQPGEAGRIYLILFDDLFITPNRTPAVRELMRRFIERNVGASDLVAVMNTGSSATFQNFTNDKALLMGAVERVFGEKAQSPTIQNLTSIDDRVSLPGGPNATSVPIGVGVTNDARLAQRGLIRLVFTMGAIEARSKAILFVSEGSPFETVQNTEGMAFFDDLRMTAEAARRSNVPIYPIDPCAQVASGEQAIEVGKIAVNDIPDPALQRELDESQRRLRALAADSGAFAIVGTNDFTRAFDRIVRQSSSYYALGYYPKNSRPDSKFRRIWMWR
jgi:VWFA-related protein